MFQLFSPPESVLLQCVLFGSKAIPTEVPTFSFAKPESYLLICFFLLLFVRRAVNQNTARFGNQHNFIVVKINIASKETAVFEPCSSLEYTVGLPLTPP
jgi:hypothetical protein